MKRPPGLWLLLSAGVLWLSLQNAYGLRATQLILGKTTSSTEKAQENEEQLKDTASTEPPEIVPVTEKSNLTGNPQLDYIYDPNLPRELNGYNLSSYPFFNSMPEDIDFKCDGLHDGFYASVPHKCQVYHHCLFGTRFDFLCANYTAFDQKTFICHFVSEVDCNNSRDYWHRNDALYEAATTSTTTTTTLKPTTVVISPTLTASPRVPPPIGRRRRPSRRRPSYEYYDEDYDDDDSRDDDYEELPPRRRRKRPRPRPRPIYLDEYDEYEDDRYDRRSSGRRPDDRRNSDDRRLPDDDRKPLDRRDPDARRPLDSDRYDRREPNRKHYDRNKPDEKRESNKNIYEESQESDDNRKPYNRREPDDRKPYDRREYDDRSEPKRNKEDGRREHDDRIRYEDTDYRYERDRRKENDRKRRPIGDYDRKGYEDSTYDRHRKNQRRPYDDDLYNNDRRTYDRPRNTPTQDPKDPTDNIKPVVKPSSISSIYSQPRAPPRIKPPVPKSEQNKFSYIPLVERPNQKRPINFDDNDDYKDDDEEIQSKRSTNRKPEQEVTRRPNNKPTNIDYDNKKEVRRPAGSASRPRIQMFRRPTTENSEDYEDEKFTQTSLQSKRKQEFSNRDNKFNSNTRNQQTFENSSVTQQVQKTPLSNKDRNTNQPKFVPKEQRIRNDYRVKSKVENRSSLSTTTSSTSTTTAPTTTDFSRERQEPVVKVVKRPFLPSRGGNPYSARGLQPVGIKAIESITYTSDQKEYDINPDVKDTVDREIALNERRPISKEYIGAKTGDVSNVHDTSITTETDISDAPIRVAVETYTEDQQFTVQNGRQFPSEPKDAPFLINEESYNDRYNTNPTSLDSYETLSQEKDIKPERQNLNTSPVMIKIPVRSKFSDPIDTESDDEFKPVSNRPQIMLRQNIKPKNYPNNENIEHGNEERNPLDIDENEYDVTLNDALNPTLPNLPIRNFPPEFSEVNDYTYSSFPRPRYDVTLNQASENRYQIRSPSQRVETVVQPIYNSAGKKYMTTGTQYNTEREQMYQNYRPSSEVTQAQTHSFYTIY